MAKKKPFEMTVDSRMELSAALDLCLEVAEAARGPGVTGKLEDLRDFAARSIALARDAADAGVMLLSVIRRLEMEATTAKMLEQLKSHDPA
jgi:hypothetical protein